MAAISAGDFFEPQLRDQRRGVGDVAKRITRAQLPGVSFRPGRVDAGVPGQSGVELRLELFDRQNTFSNPVTA